MKRIPPLLSLLLLVLALPAAGYAQGSAPTPVLQNPLSCPDLICLFLQVIRLFLGAVAAFATFMFMYGGFLLLSSGGSPDRIQKGKDTLTWAALGIITILGSWVIIQFILEATTGVT